MREFEMELGVGDSIQVGDHILTVVDVDRGEITLRVDSDTASGESVEQTIEPAAVKFWRPR